MRSIALLHAKHREDASSAQHKVDRVTSAAGRPLFLGLVCAAVVLWIAVNVALPLFKLHAIDPPPFAWLELVLTLTALVIAVLILITQGSADRLADVRGQMTLELALLTEQKAAKIIELVEELRRDSPEIHDRVDSEARDMATRADPHAVLGAIKKIDKEKVAPTDLESASAEVQKPPYA